MPLYSSDKQHRPFKNLERPGGLPTKPHWPSFSLYFYGTSLLHSCSHCERLSFVWNEARKMVVLHSGSISSTFACKINVFFGEQRLANGAQIWQISALISDKFSGAKYWWNWTAIFSPNVLRQQLFARRKSLVKLTLGLFVCLHHSSTSSSLTKAHSTIFHKYLWVRRRKAFYVDGSKWVFIRQVPPPPPLFTDLSFHRNCYLNDIKFLPLDCYVVFGKLFLAPANFAVH